MPRAAKQETDGAQAAVSSSPSRRAALAVPLDALIPQQRARGPQGSHTAALPASDPQTLEMTDSI